MILNLLRKVALKWVEKRVHESLYLLTYSSYTGLDFLAFDEFYLVILMLSSEVYDLIFCSC